MANKTPDEIAAMVESARGFLKANSLRTMSASSDEAVRKQGERQMAEFLNNFKGWSSQDLNNLQGALLKKFDEEMQNAPLRIDGNANTARQNLNKEMRSVFQNLFDIESVVKRGEGAIPRVEIVESQQNQPIQREEQSSVAKPAESKAFLQKVKDIVNRGTESINAKVSEVKTVMEEKRKERKIEQQGKKIEQGGSLLEKLAQKAKNKIAELGDKAMERIMKLSSKSRGGDVEMKEMQIGLPKNVRKAGAASVEAEIHEGHATKIDFMLQDTMDMLENARTISDGAKPIADSPSIIDQIYAEIEAVDASINNEVGEFAGSAEALMKAEEVVTREDVQDLNLEFDFDNQFGPSTTELKQVATEADQALSNLDKPLEKAKSVEKPASFEEKMDELDKALKAIDDAEPAKSSAKSPEPTKDPGSGPSSPRGGP
ncbi:MAG: hypothetical protein SFW07_04515 [Gammaproteobacteria bacterium]|nr:hypothetical protein [Gammaproteobacteria bacterium]